MKENKNTPRPTVCINKDKYVPIYGIRCANHNTIADKIANKINFPFEVIFSFSVMDFAIAKLKIERLIARIKPYIAIIAIERLEKRPVKNKKNANTGISTTAKTPIPVLTNDFFIRA